MKRLRPSETIADALRSVALPDFCTASDLAEHLGIAPSTVRRALREGHLPGRRCGRRWLVSRSALVEWLATPEPSKRATPIRHIRGGTRKR